MLSLSHDKFSHLFTKKLSVHGKGSIPVAVCTDPRPLGRLCVLGGTAKPANSAAPTNTLPSQRARHVGRKREEEEEKRRGVPQGAGRWEERTSREGREKAEKKEEKGEEMKDKGRRKDRPGRRRKAGEERRQPARRRGKGQDTAPRGPCVSWPRRWPPCWPRPRPQVSGSASSPSLRPLRDPGAAGSGKGLGSARSGGAGRSPARHGGRLGTEGKDGTRRPRPLLPHRRGSSARSRGFRAKPHACTAAAGKAFSTASFVRRDCVRTTANKVEAKTTRTPRSLVIENNPLLRPYASKI